MTLDTLEPDHAEVVGLLQPFVDGELSDDERALVADQIADNPEYQAIVRDQQQVRALLRSLPREVASPELRARVLVDLEAVDGERRAAERRGWFAPVLGRVKAFGRGAMLMVPAAAAATVLFVVASNAGWLENPALDGSHVDGGLANSLSVRAPRAEPPPAPSGPTERLAGGTSDPNSRLDGPLDDPLDDPSLPNPPEAELGFAVQIAPQRSLPAGVALVSDDPQSASSSAMVRYRDSGGAVMVDRQRRAGVAPLRGTRQVFRDHEYYLGRDDLARPRLEFQVGRVHHSLVLEGAEAPVDQATTSETPEFQRLLIVADALRRAHGG